MLVGLLCTVFSTWWFEEHLEQVFCGGAVQVNRTYGYHLVQVIPYAAGPKFGHRWSNGVCH